ncbi:hypothetical protein B0T21DRAFT_299584 [Apiosordaria backusii]|uniref:Uncharacterized protein n=1 Tax=Apiosordaria backusii TaxID=314023 RepID=A0AA39ZSP8_9PEZI|nr:hypothetical protein B0T21DRAFT_299584 [Apiosordaria backusii]
MSPSDELEEMLNALTTLVASIHLLTNRPEYHPQDDSLDENQEYIVPRVNKMLNIANGWVMKLEDDLKRERQRERDLAEQRGWGGWAASSLSPAVSSRAGFNELIQGLDRVKMGIWFAIEGNPRLGRETVSRGVCAFEGWI